MNAVSLCFCVCVIGCGACLRCVSACVLVVRVCCVWLLQFVCAVLRAVFVLFVVTMIVVACACLS